MPSIDELEQSLERLPVEALGSATANVTHRTVLRHEWLRDVADVLHGTWLGHPLHPALTDLVIGAWLTGGAFDLASEWQGSTSARWAGDRLAEIGTAAALPTALSGLVDFSAATPEATPSGTLHALLNGGAFVLYGASLLERRWGNRRRGLAFSWLAQGLVLASSWIGGKLVYEHRMGVDQRERFEGPDTWRAVLHDADLPEGQPRRVEVDGKGVLLYRHEGEIFAIGAVCSHAGGPLEEGSFDGTCVQCPWHDSVFDMRDGHVVHGPATVPETCFEVRVRGGKIALRYVGS